MIDYKSNEQPTPLKPATSKAPARKVKKRKSLMALQLELAERNATAKQEGKTPTVEIYC